MAIIDAEILDNKDNLVRYAGDTNPEKMILKINGAAIDLEGWNVVFRYNKDGLIREIDCSLMASNTGEILVHPHDRGVGEPNIIAKITDDMAFEDNSLTSNQCWTKDESDRIYDFSVIRKRKFNDGLDVEYEEQMTHRTGKIILLSRV